MSFSNRFLGVVALLLSAHALAECPAHLQGEYRKLHSTESVNLCQLAKAKVLLVANTASHCGFTEQFKGLEALHRVYKDKGLVVIGFASDDFKQEDGDESKAANICFVNFGVTFTMIAPSHVRGAQANPLFQYLGQEAGTPKWNFNKYLLSKDGKVIQHFGSMTTLEAASLRNAIESELNH